MPRTYECLTVFRCWQCGEETDLADCEKIKKTNEKDVLICSKCTGNNCREGVCEVATASQEKMGFFNTSYNPPFSTTEN